MANPSVKLFLSCVSDEFRGYRNALRGVLTRPNVEVKIQEDFKSQGGDTLSKLEEYIEHCEAVVHFIGELTGSAPPDFSVDALLARHRDLKTRLPPLGAAIEAGEAISYTQWEAWLALYFGKNLEIVIPASRGKRGGKVNAGGASRAAQTEHLARLRSVGIYPNPPFTNLDNLIALILNTSIIKALVKAEKAAPARQPRNLPFATLGPLFMGREREVDDLRAALVADKSVAVASRALHGLGGVGKTRLAIEYALRQEADYSALLFVRAADPVTLNASLAALASAEVLDLYEKEAREDVVKREAALRWLDAYPTWLMILDNVDDEEAIAAVVSLMARLKGGHVIVTGRAANFPASIRKLELGVLNEEAAVAFLVERTRDDRAIASDDAAQARALAGELAGLALGLEQAGAYIAVERIGFAHYLALWRERRESVLNWFDKNLMSYNHDVGLAATWATSVARLSPESRRFLDRLAFFAPDPIPDSLIDIAVPGEGADYNAQGARAGLYAYSLITRAIGEDGVAKGFVIHRLVQDFARRAMTVEGRGEALQEALHLVNSVFVGHSTDVRAWLALDPLAPHALAVARHADEAAITRPTSRLFSELALWSLIKARYVEAETLARRALTIDEASLGPDHPDVAIRLTNLANVLSDTNRLADAEPLRRRALAIGEASYGAEHPTVSLRLNNLANLLRDTGRLAEAEPLYRRALAIDEARSGSDHPDVAVDLNNLGGLLHKMNRLAEAEPLFHRALAIFEKSYGSHHPATAMSLSGLAGLMIGTNRLGEAEPLYRRALAIDEASYGPDHPLVANDFSNLAELLRRINRVAEAEQLFRRAVAIFEKTDGRDPQVEASLNNFALLLQATNRVAEAEPLLRRVLAIDEARFGPHHPKVAGDLNNLAESLRAANRLAEAEPLFRRALAIFEKSYAADSPQVAMILNNLALLLDATNRAGEAEPLYRRALGIQEASFGSDHLEVARVLNNLALLLHKANRVAEAEPPLRRALAIFDKSLGPHDPNTVNSRKGVAMLERARRGA